MTDELLPHLATTETVTVITTRPDGSQLATPIWSAVVDEVAYVRAAFGPRTSWYLRARSGRPVAFTLADGRRAERDPIAALDDRRVDVRVDGVAPGAPEHDAIDRAFRAKYGHSPHVDSVTAASVRELTLRVTPL